MPVGNWNLQWLNHNAQRSYPLTSRASKKDVTGTFTIPDDFIVGLRLNFATDYVTDVRANINQITVSNIGVCVYISVYTATGVLIQGALRVCINKAEHVKNNTYALTSYAEDRVTGSITINEINEILNQPAGWFNFDEAAGEIESDVISVSTHAIRSLQILSDGARSEKLYGDIVLVAGENIKILIEKDWVSFNQLETRLVIHAISGKNLNEDCTCDVNNVAPCIRSINGISTTTGNFNFAPNGCINLTEAVNGVEIADICAEPCCGCSELDALRTQVERFGDGITTLQNFVTRLGSEVAQMSVVVIGSRLSTATCNSGG